MTTTQSLDYDTIPVGEVVGPFKYKIPADFNLKRLPTIGVRDRSCMVDAQGREIAEPSVLCGQHTWTLRRRFHWFGSVHAKCDIEYLGPVYVGSNIEVTSTVSEKYERRGGKYVVFLLETRRDDGQLACKVRNTVLLNFAEVHAARQSAVAGKPQPDIRSESREASGAPACISAGPFAFERQSMIDFFGSDEDVYGLHPSIHGDSAIAAKLGLKDIIAPGRYGIGLMNGALLRLFGPRALQGAHYDLSILNNLEPGMVANAVIRESDVGVDRERRVFRFDCKDQVSGKMLLSGGFSFGRAD